MYSLNKTYNRDIAILDNQFFSCAPFQEHQKVGKLQFLQTYT